mmetsp:Transcript_974/g.1841  ORF Transcript_974/g.1841 Transcript_974/m.1841 type:complete len:218 (-) Transcript_974:64-717(-)|eukprot:CAMPEP_0181326446 /NCGR_PEP_ID=MMETSP1101-20121128/21501_1 /TAXON_ID=46948 /ORGANISM="Rhodomonas abbreviata, Strain Caron Lab Isolate" /LENGTH=217 /DNA_ID=CAMNT_0023434897 /DNA_START=133 /DNA_END=786 /DNA_ORIENTATION=+
MDGFSTDQAEGTASQSQLLAAAALLQLLGASEPAVIDAHEHKASCDPLTQRGSDLENRSSAGWELLQKDVKPQFYDPIHAKLTPEVVSGATFQTIFPTNASSERHEQQSSPSARSTPKNASSSEHARDNQSSTSKRSARPWTLEEHQCFLAALEKFRTPLTEKITKGGKRSVGLGPGIADMIALILKTRNAAQVRSHAQKHFQRQRREGDSTSPCSG